MNAAGKSKGYLESHRFSLVYKVLLCLLLLILKLSTLFGQFILFVGKFVKMEAEDGKSCLEITTQ